MLILKEEIQMEGRGLFLGLPVKLSIKPIDRPGIFFKRVDIEDSPLIEASIENLEPNTVRHNALVKGKSRIETIEHILSALHAFRITNVIIEVNAPEIAIFDGSSDEFAKKLLIAKTERVETEVYTISSPVVLSNEYSTIEALPCTEFKVNYSLKRNWLPTTQTAQFTMTEKSYMEEIAPARTFAEKQVVIKLKQFGFFRNTDGSEGIIVDNGKPHCPLRFENEYARHKILDIIGDLSLLQKQLHLHIIASSSGHKENIELARLIEDKLILEKTVTL